MILALLLAQAATMPAPMPAAPPVDCSRVRVALPPALAGWGGTPSVAPTIGRVFTMAAKPAASGAAPARRPGGVATATLRVMAAGTYSVAIDQAAWIDVVAAGASLASVAHRHGPPCSGIRKIVDFSLAPGDVRIVVSGVTTPQVRMLVAPAS